MSVRNGAICTVFIVNTLLSVEDEIGLEVDIIGWLIYTLFSLNL